MTPLGQVPTATTADAARAVALVLLPVVARGALVRRPRVVGVADRMDADARAVTEMQRLRDRYGPGPVLLDLPARRFTVLLEPGHVRRVLDETPVPFAADTREKRAALGHFQPDGVLISPPSKRPQRRALNEEVLDTGRPVHRLAETIREAVDAEVGALLGHVAFRGSLDWDAFALAWWRIVRRVVLGPSARDDEETTDLLLGLRADANWAYLRPPRKGRRRLFLDRLQGYVEHPEPAGLASLVASTPAPPDAAPVQQIPQWLFAFDAGAWATFRALALVLAHPGAADRAAAESPRSPDLPFARACVLESLRLWPTTPAILRDATQDTTWDTGILPAGSSVLVYAPFFHRDESRVPEAHRFAPELWLRERGDDDWPLVPFSGGPAMCPGRNLVLLVTSLVLVRLLAHLGHQVDGATPDPQRRLPATLSPFGLRFAR